MASLGIMQSYAEKGADKLGVTDKPLLRWSGEPCKISRTSWAHCHITNHTLPRGTICIYKGLGQRKIRNWHNTIAHEVSHLAVKSFHSSPTFARRMVSLGVANQKERLMAKAGKKHRHIYNTRYYLNGEYIYSTCMICHRKSK